MQSFKHADKLDGLVSKAMEKAKAPGVSLALFKDDEIVYKQGYGSRNIAESKPATPDTLYGIGSCTKSFICFAVMKQVEQGNITVDTPIRDHLPVNVGHEDSPITVKSLMSHSSGFPSLGAADVLIAKKSLGDHWLPLTSQGDFYNFLNHAQDRLDARPGERYYYLNSGYTLLGLLLEELTGETLETYLRKIIWKPLGMKRTTFLEESFNNDSDRMTAYWNSLKEGQKPTVHPFHELIYAPGGILSSVVESTSYLDMYLNNGAYKGKQLLEEDLIQEMTKRHSKRPSNIFGEGGYGYGWGSMDFNGETLIAHTGSTGVSGANYSYIPELGIAVAYLTNTGYWGNIIPHAALAYLMELDPVEALPYLKRTMFMEKLSGTYKTYRGIAEVVIKPQGGVLMAENTAVWGTLKIPLIPATDEPEETVFHIFGGEYGRQKVWFELDETETRIYNERWVYKKTVK